MGRPGTAGGGRAGQRAQGSAGPPQQEGEGFSLREAKQTVSVRKSGQEQLPSRIYSRGPSFKGWGGNGSNKAVAGQKPAGSPCAHQEGRPQACTLDSQARAFAQAPPSCSWRGGHWVPLDKAPSPRAGPRCPPLRVRRLSETPGTQDARGGGCVLHGGRGCPWASAGVRGWGQGEGGSVL